MYSIRISRFSIVVNCFLLCIESVNGNDITEPETYSFIDSINRIVNVSSNAVNKIDAVSFPENVFLQREYDFIIIGSSPSGCVMANRLSNGNYSVLLLEAGSAENPIITDIPMSAHNLHFSEYNWNYVTEPQDEACLCTYRFVWVIFFYEIDLIAVLQ